MTIPRGALATLVHFLQFNPVGAVIKHHECSYIGRGPSLEVMLATTREERLCGMMQIMKRRISQIVDPPHLSEEEKSNNAQ